MNRTATGMLVVLLALGATMPGWAQAAASRNERLFAVPAPPGAKIDGDLTGWDRSGGVFTYITPETRAMHSTRTYLMYDDEALYLGGEVKDPTPMVNMHDPDVNPGFGWDADAMQFRLYLKPQYPGTESGWDSKGGYEIVSLLLWYFTGKQEPVLQLSYSMKYLPPKQGWKGGVVPHEFYQAVYRKDADGRGYSFAYRIPWDTLSDQYRLKAGDLTAGTFQYMWGTPDGMKTLGIAGWAYDLLRMPGFPYQSSVCWGKIIFSGQGNLPKEITQEGVEPVPPAPLTFSYDLPKDGVVTIALVDKRGSPIRNIISAQQRAKGQVVEAWDGLDDKGDPLPAGTYQWKGLYHDPLQVVWKLSVHNSGKPGYPTADGKGSWGGDHGVPCTVAAAGDRMILGWDVGEAGWATIATDLEGNKQWGGRWWCRQVVADKEYAYFYGGMGDMGVMRVNVATGFQEKFTNNEQFVALPEGWKGEPSGLALSGDRLYVACPRMAGETEGAGRIAEVDKVSGKLLRTMSVSGGVEASVLGHVAVRSADELYVVLGGRVCTCNTKDLMSVESLLKPLAPGAECRLWAKDHTDDPQGIAVAPDGTVYVANRGKLQNISVFDKNGKYLRSLGAPGGRPALGKWRSDGMLNPAGIALDSRGRLWVTEANPAPKRISVWDTKTGKLVAEYFGGSAYSTYVSMDPNDPTRVYCHATQWKVDLDKGTWFPEAIVTGPEHDAFFTVLTGPNGKQYAVTRFLTVLMRRGDVFEPVGGFLPLKQFEQDPWYADWVKAHPNKPSVFWSDTNGDGKVTLDEISEPPFGIPYWGGAMDEKLTLYSAGNQDGPITAHRLKVTRILPNGVPLWDPSKSEGFGPGERGYSNSCIGDPQTGTVYLLGGGYWGKKQYPGLNAYADDGRHLWGYWNVATDWTVALNNGIPPKGTAWGMTRWMGKAGEFLAGLNYFGTIDLWTSDGIYVDKIYQDQRLGKTGPDVINAEFFDGQFVRTKNGRYLLLAGDSDGRVNELLGLDTVKRLQGTYTLSQEEVDKAAAERAAFAAQKARAQSLVIHRLAGLDWAQARSITRKLDDTRRFKVAAAYDEKDLVLRYEVQSPTELTNAITEPNVIFKGGNCLDLELQTDPNADPARKTAGVGDVRLIITRQNGQSVAIGYFKQVAGFGGQPVTLTSPTGQEVFDKIERLPVQMEYQPEPGGFTVLVKIPLEALGLKLTPAGAQRLDVGYRFGNETGSQVGQRAYWSNTSALANIIYDIPSEVRMEPANWGTAVVE